MTAAIKMRAARVDYEHGLIVSLDNGGEAFYEFRRQVEPKSVIDSTSKSAEVPAGEDFTYCEWVCESQFREGTCSRSAARNHYGLSLCWQHKDMVFSHVIQQLDDGAYYWAQTERLAASLLAADANEPRSGGGYMQKLVERKVRERIESLLHSRYLEPETAELLDQLIESRLQQKWGA